MDNIIYWKFKFSTKLQTIQLKIQYTFRKSTTSFNQKEKFKFCEEPWAPSMKKIKIG
jgi:hypothetical protein